MHIATIGDGGEIAVAVLVVAGGGGVDFVGAFGNDETSSEDGAKDSTIFAISTFGLRVII